MNLIVDASTRCLQCDEKIPYPKGWKFAAVTESPEGAFIFCCSGCRMDYGLGGTGRICSVIPEGAPIPSQNSYTSPEEMGCWAKGCTVIGVIMLIVGLINTIGYGFGTGVISFFFAIPFLIPYILRWLKNR